MDDMSKPWWQSKAVWGGVSAILGGISALLLVAAGQAGADTVFPALLSIAGGAQAIYGRLVAVQRLQ